MDGFTDRSNVSRLLYGFSAYVVGQGYGHVMLSFVPLPPIYFYWLHKMVVRRAGRPYKEGVIVGLILVGQYLISSEIMATLVLMSGIGFVIYIVGDRHLVTSQALGYIVKGLVGTAVVLIASLSYPVWFSMFGTQHFDEPVRTVHDNYHAVALGSFVPTTGQRFSPPVLSNYRHVIDPVSGQYLGIPLILLLLLFCVWFRRNRAFMYVVSLAVISFVLSLGLHFSWLHLNGSLPLPGAVIAHVPWLTFVA